jgi:GrpB-like predicted nucleotidyltransferase (UPF0157 family)
VEGNKAHLDHVLVRDLLREGDEAREQYAALKRANATAAAGPELEVALPGIGA